MRNYLIAVVLAFLLWLWPEAIGFAVFAMLAPPLCDTSCCATCAIFTDDFATDRTGTDYTIVSGTPTVSSGVLTTGSTGFLIVENTAGTTGHGRVTITGKADTSGGTFRVIGSYVDSSNYLFGELTINGASSTWKLWKRVSGSDTQLGITTTFTASTSTNYTICVSWDGTYAVGIATIGSAIKLTRDAFTGSGNKAGFGASPNGGTVTFDDFTFAKAKIDDAACVTCGGNVCGSSLAYDGGFEFNISGWGGCCAGFDGLYIIPYQVDTAGAYTPCKGSISVTDPCFGTSTFARWDATGSNLTFGVYVGLSIYYQFIIAKPSDLSTYSSDAMTYDTAAVCNVSISPTLAGTVTSI